MESLVVRYLLWLSISVWLGLVSMWLHAGFAYDWVLSLVVLVVIALIPQKDKVLVPKNIWFYILLLPILYQAYHVSYIDRGWVQTFHPNNLGDFPFHYHLSAYLQNASLWPENHMYSGQPLTYAFGTNLFQAMWMDSAIPGLSVFVILSILFVVITYFYSYQIGGLVFTALVFYSSGWGLEPENLKWKSFWLASFFTQRSYIYILPFGLLWLHRLFTYVSQKKEISNREVLVYGILFGSAAIFSYHATFILAIISLGVFAMQPSRKMLILGCLAILIGIYFPLHAAIISNFSSRWQWHWDFSSEPITYIKDCLLNFSFVYAIWFYAIYKWQSIRKHLVFSLLLFLLFQFWILAPWAWDNVKLLIWAYLYFISFLCFQNVFSTRVQLVLVILLSGLGIYKTFAYTFLPTPVAIWQQEELEDLAKVLPPYENTCYWVYPTYNHPLYFYGRRVALSYPGHLWSHGIEYAKRLERIEEARKKSSYDFNLALQSLGCAYLLDTRVEQIHYPLQNFQDFRPVIKTEKTTLYRVGFD